MNRDFLTAISWLPAAAIVRGYACIPNLSLRGHCPTEPRGFHRAVTHGAYWLRRTASASPPFRNGAAWASRGGTRSTRGGTRVSACSVVSAAPLPSADEP